jgi:methionine synthase II (cobalamin-independent)
VISRVKEIAAFKRVWRKPYKKGVVGESTEIQVHYAVVEKIRRQRSLTNGEFSYSRSRAKVALKVTLPSPLMVAL